MTIDFANLADRLTGYPLTTDHIIETGDEDYSSEERQWLQDHGYYGKPVNDRIIELVRGGNDFEEPTGYVLVYSGGDGAEETVCDSYEDMQQKLIGADCVGGKYWVYINREYGSTYALPRDLDWDAIGLETYQPYSDEPTWRLRRKGTL